MKFRKDLNSTLALLLLLPDLQLIGPLLSQADPQEALQGAYGPQLPLHPLAEHYGEEEAVHFYYFAHVVPQHISDHLGLHCFMHVLSGFLFCLHYVLFGGSSSRSLVVFSCTEIRNFVHFIRLFGLSYRVHVEALLQHSFDTFKHIFILFEKVF